MWYHVACKHLQSLAQLPLCTLTWIIKSSAVLQHYFVIVWHCSLIPQVYLLSFKQCRCSLWLAQQLKRQGTFPNSFCSALTFLICRNMPTALVVNNRKESIKVSVVFSPTYALYLFWYFWTSFVYQSFHLLVSQLYADCFSCWYQLSQLLAENRNVCCRWSEILGEASAYSKFITSSIAAVVISS